MKKVYLCEYCISELLSRGEKVFIGDLVSRDEIDEPFECGLCGSDYLYGDEPDDCDELYECMW